MSQFTESENRKQIRREVRNQWRTLIRIITTPAKRNVNGEKSYICPICGHGKGGDGLTRDPKSYDGNGLKCFGCGFSGDIIDLYMQVNNTDFNTALNILAAEIGYKLEAESNFQRPKKNGPADGRQSHEAGLRQGDIYLNNKAPETGAQRATEQPLDFTAYYQRCDCGNVTDPAAIGYLTSRGISLDTANKCRVGFDLEADPANAPGAVRQEFKPHPAPRVIIPCTKNFYIARSIDPEAEYKAPNPKGSNTAPFLYGLTHPGENKVVFVVEGVFDALSLIDCGAPAISLNGAANGDILTKYLDKHKPRCSFILCPDNDADPVTADRVHAQFNKLAANLKAAGYNAILFNVAGACKDINDLLRADRPQLETNIAEALTAARSDALPGLLTLDAAINEFVAANDKSIMMRNFPEFCRLAKISLHDSIVLAADTGAGKSSLALNFINELNDDYPILYFNLEMDSLTILRRLVAIRSGMELDQIEGYRNDTKTAAAVNETLRQLTSRKPLQVLRNVYSLTEIEETIKKSTQGRKDPTIVFIDHSLLVTVDGRAPSRYERFTQISEGLRRISRNNNIILFVLLQQSREGKKDEKERPKNYSLKESGSWENDATQIVFLWQDPNDNCKKLLLTKNRSGVLGDVVLNYYPHTQTYKEIGNGSNAPKDTRGEFVPGDWLGENILRF